MKLRASFIFGLICLSTWFTGVRELGEFNTSLFLRVGILTFAVICISIYFILSKSKTLLRPNTQVIFFAVFYSYCLISALGNPFYLFMGYKIFECLIVIIATYLFVNSEVQLDQKIRFYFLFLAITLSIIGISSLLYPEQSYIPVQSALPFRLRGELIPMNSNDVGCLSTALLAFFLCLRRSHLGVAFSILLVALSGSRVFLVIATLLLILFSVRESGSVMRRWASYAIILGSAFVLVLIYIDPILLTLSRGDDTQLYTLHGRTFYWGLGFSAFLESPIFGSGFYVTHRFMDNLMPSYGFSSSTFDNSFLDVAAGTGLIGLFLYLGLFFWMFRKSMSLNDDRLRRFFFASTIILFARGLTGPGLVVYGHIFIYFIFVVMSLGKVESNEIRT